MNVEVKQVWALQKVLQEATATRKYYTQFITIGWETLSLWNNENDANAALLALVPDKEHQHNFRIKKYPVYETR